jgi:chromosome segregation ATPase
LEADLETMAQRVVDATFPKDYHVRKLRGSVEIAEKLIENLRTNNLLDIREVKRVCNAEMTKAVKQAVKVLKIEQSEKDTNYGKKILKLQSELQELRQPKSPADERAMQAELKMVRLEAKLKKQSEQTEKYRLMAESVREELDGESIEELKERLKSAELDWDFAQDRCNILQTNMDDARKRLTEAEDGVRTRTHELENMSCKLYMANALANTLRQERKRDGKGDIFVEDGRVLFRCEMCLEVDIFLIISKIYSTNPDFPTAERGSHPSRESQARSQRPSPSLRALSDGLWDASSSEALPVLRPAVGFRLPCLGGGVQEPVGAGLQAEIRVLCGNGMMWLYGGGR